MIAPSTRVDLDDADAVLAADALGGLHSAALAGAQIRSTAAAVAEGVLRPLDGLRPRSVVLVAPAGPAVRAAALIVAVLAPTAGVPVVHTSATPPWVGPLDVVVVAGDDAGDPVLAQSIAAAVRRRSEVVVAVPDEGPVAGAGAGRVIALPPRVRVLHRNSLSQYVAIMSAVLAAVDTASSVGDLDVIADAVDAEIARHHASVEVFANPAKGLASRMLGRRVVLTGDGVAATEVARHGAAVLLRASGVVASATELSDALAAVHDFGRLGGGGGESDSFLDGVDHPAMDPMFHDDQLDGPRPADPVRILAVTTDSDDGIVRRRIAALGDVDVVRADDAETDGSPVGLAAAPDSGTTTTVLRRSLVLAVRLESAAAYLHVTGGQGMDRSSGATGGRW